MRDRPIRVGIIDSGVNEAHSHVGRIAGGVRIAVGVDGCLQPLTDYTDRLGHGTAIAGIIRAKLPAAELYAIKVFDDHLRTFPSVVAAGIGWAIDHDLDLINVSLGVADERYRSLFQAACDAAEAKGSLIVAAQSPRQERCWPASLANVFGVKAGDCSADEWRYHPEDVVPLSAHGYPRPLDVRQPRRNLRGNSFAAAHVTGFIGQILQRWPEADRDFVIRRLAIGSSRDNERLR
ncbi:S8 family serine peptidase [Heliobacterium gestii]|uniref:S8 family serine peptidase n=1 Tax=Heliomicrobium gestii TaxID=2699 RepID=A0A845L9S7_HELGE|nr:S8 family serine peptidase [Heliomicrobium gestii]MBM7866236.1 subtilisin family serine protease [Heliomicrobium gestii]MZP42968.1 S8 family serine peptidase [Heliomicrobium gestii]